MKKVILCLVAACSLVSAATFNEAQIREFEQKCEVGDAIICGSVGISYYMGDNGFTKDYEKAAKFFAKACDGNNYKTCSNLGFMYSTGQGVVIDPDKAAELYVKACEGGDVFGCQNVGAMYLKGQGVKADAIKGLGYIKIACDKGLWGACLNFALANELIGQKTKSEASFKAAKEYFKKACDLGKNDRSAQVIEEQKKIWLQACEKYEALRKQNY